jgi:hypothetical protein
MTSDEAKTLSVGTEIQAEFPIGEHHQGQIIDRLIGDHGVDIMWDHGYRGYFAYADAAFWGKAQVAKC